jgi:ADP-dependent NAD(P)H-hydrate dehydratase
MKRARTVQAPPVKALEASSLRRWPLPMPGHDDDKNARGRVLIVAGCSAMPGAAILAADAALRAGAGKLTIATVRSIAPIVAAMVPESKVVALAESTRGGVEARAASALDVDGEFDAVLIGPGMEDEAVTCRFVTAMLRKSRQVTLVLDAVAMSVVAHTRASASFRFDGPTILTPHCGEMAHLLGVEKREVESDPLRAAFAAARQWNAVVTLKSATTFIASDATHVWRHEHGNPGLAVSGSGDTLAGIIAGLASRGASAEQAAAWAVFVHGAAGDRLRRRYGPVGYLAREIAGEVPGLLAALGSRRKRASK